jgi:hypothetical protein
MKKPRGRKMKGFESFSWQLHHVWYNAWTTFVIVSFFAGKCRSITIAWGNEAFDGSDYPFFLLKSRI